MIQERKWSEKTTKEKLDLVAVVVTIVALGLTAYVHIKKLSK